MKKIMLLFWLTTYISFAQDFKSLKSKYPTEDVVTLTDDEQLTIDLKKGKLSISKKNIKRNIYLKTGERTYSDEQIRFNNFNRINNVKAYTDNTLIFLGKKKKRKELFKEVTDFEEEDIIIRGVFYSDSKRKTFTYPAVNKKSITNLTYQTTIKDAHFITPFYLGSPIPIESSSYEVKVHKDVRISYKTFHIDTTKVTFIQKNSGDYVNYKWVFKDIEKMSRYYDFSPTYYIPQIAILVNSYKVDGKQHRVLQNVEDLYQWYQQLITNINSKDQSSLKKITLDLIRNISSNEEKIKKLYYFVQEKINYIAFEYGMGGFIPRDATDVYTKKYGDCKDMANILNEMLRYAGIDSYLTWIGTRDKPYSYYDLPTTSADNHMIVTIKNKDGFIFLDPTAEYLPYGYPSPNIQGKEALIGLSKETHTIKIVDEIPAKENSKTVYSKFQLDSLGYLKGEHKVQLIGYQKLDFHHQFARKKKVDKDFIRLTLSLGDRKTIFYDELYSNITLDQDTLNIKFSSKSPNNIHKIEENLYVRINLDRELKKELVKNKSMDFDKKVDYKFENQTESLFKVPNNYKVLKKPKNASFLNENFGYSISYTINQDQTITLKKRIHVNTLKIPTKQIKEWNRFIRSLFKEYKKSIILTPKK